MHMPSFRAVLALALAVAALAAGCVSKGDTEISQGEDTGVPPTCNSVCERLQAATFGDCKKWDDYQDCIGECEDHRPILEGLECLEQVADCDAFRTCDSTYDIF
jgi:hypothetical protein